MPSQIPHFFFPRLISPLPNIPFLGSCTVPLSVQMTNLEVTLRFPVFLIPYVELIQVMCQLHLPSGSSSLLLLSSATIGYLLSPLLYSNRLCPGVSIKSVKTTKKKHHLISQIWVWLRAQGNLLHRQFRDEKVGIRWVIFRSFLCLSIHLHPILLLLLPLYFFKQK